MEKLTSQEIRKMWLSFWESKGHLVVPNKSLIPVNDDSLLWINSGVATIKDFFTGKKISPSPRLTNSQTSLRTNDIENVGVTARHLTLFEMLGNFSIGDYFKQEVIPWAFELLTKIFNIPLEKLYFTYFEEDQDTYNAWKKLGIEESHLIKGSRKTNFWDLGSGPCGPCTEIFFDRGEKYDFDKVGIKLLQEDIENDRYIEIWNIVFSQFNNNGLNEYQEMKQKNIDTGAGFERLVSIFQDVPTNFDTDLFQPIIKKIETLTPCRYDVNNYFVKDEKQNKINKYFRIIADHIRASTFAINDGEKPSNSQRGYIIRRLIRRAYYSTQLLDIKDETFLYTLVPIIAEIMPDFKIDVNKVQAIIIQEEKQFASTINNGKKLLDEEIANHHLNNQDSEKIAFKLFETYGFPLELTMEIISEHGINLDLKKLEELKAKHANASRSENKIGMDKQIQVIQQIESLQSKFVGYETLSVESNLIFQGQEDGKTYLLFDKTPFYAKGGGQASDRGLINDIEVEDVFKDKYGNIWHVVSSQLNLDQATLKVDSRNRNLQAKNHSATHLLNYALKQVFDSSVIQLGSDNNAQRLRFDFPLQTRPSQDEINKVENLVRELIKQNHHQDTNELPISQAKETGAVMLENEEYSDIVRVVKIGPSIELCGGTHVNSTNEIEDFKIVKFESKGSNIFRIEAITTFDLINQYNQSLIDKMLENINLQIAKNQSIDSTYKFTINQASNLHELEQALESLQNDFKRLNKEQKSLDIDIEIKPIIWQGIKTIIKLDFDNSNILKNLAINLREKHPDALIILGSPNGNKINIAFASKVVDSKLYMDKIFNKFNGRGGGNNNFAMGSCDLVTLEMIE